MDEISERQRPSPKAFLLINLAGPFFVDLASASGVTLLADDLTRAIRPRILLT